MKVVTHRTAFDQTTKRYRVILAIASLLATLTIGPPPSTVMAANPPVGAVSGGATPGVNAAQPPPGMTFSRRLGGGAPGTRAAPAAVGLPLRVKIPRISVDAAVESVATTSDGSMDVPRLFEDTAWYQPGPRPGQAGNAVIAGHVDSTTGPAVFWALRTLAPGDRIVVVGDDKIERAFVVSALESYARDKVPLDRVFGNASAAHLNLITCDRTSAFDPRVQSYDNNFIVYADLAP